MAGAWNLDALRAHIRDRRESLGLSDQDVAHLLAACNSLAYSLAIYVYHEELAADALNEHMPDWKSLTPYDLSLHLIGKGKYQHTIGRAQLVSQANITACLHTVRAAMDMYAQLVNQLACDDAREIWRCDFSNLRSLHPPIRDEVDRIRGSEPFKYIDAFINVTKHRYLIQQGTPIGFFGMQFGFRVESFNYNGAYFEHRRDSDVLALGKSLFLALLTAGQLLNQHLGLQPCGPAEPS